MYFREVKPFGGFHCKVCGTWSPEKHETPCPSCPGHPLKDMTAVDTTNCEGCGGCCRYDGRAKCPICWDCLSRVYRTTCKYRFHKGKRAKPSTEVDQFLYRHKDARGNTIEELVQCCKECYYLYSGKTLFPRYDRNGELVEGEKLRLFNGDPLWRYGGKVSVWRPQVGDEITARLRGTAIINGATIAHGVAFPSGRCVILANSTLIPMLDDECFRGHYCIIRRTTDGWNVTKGLSIGDIQSNLSEEL